MTTSVSAGRVDGRQSRRGWTACVGAVTVRPWLWLAAVRAVGRMAPRGWWHRPPFVPRPDPAYLRFRLETQYGDTGRPTPDDIVSYLEWCRGLQRLARGRGVADPTGGRQ